MLDFLRRVFGNTKPAPGPGRRVEEEDPSVTVERSLAGLERELAQADESLRAVAAMRSDLAVRRAQVDEAIAHHAGQAERALPLGREDLARQALALRWEMERRRNEMDESLAEVDRQEAALEAARDALRQKVEQLRVRKVEMDARLAAADAQVRLREVMASVPGDIAAVTRAQERLDEHVEATRARAEALAGLSPQGSDVGGQGDSLERQIRDLERARRVDVELERIKREALAEKGVSAAEEGKE